MKRYIIVIDQSTSASKVMLVNNRGRILRRASAAHMQFREGAGFSEQDVQEIYQNVVSCIETVTDGVAAGEIAALAISNQRETTAFWHRATGLPARRAIVWQDVRAASVCDALRPHAESIRQTTGLALSAYYPAAKAAFAFQRDARLRALADSGDLCIGTIDSYLIYRLTEGKTFATDITNASRTQLFHIHTQTFDPALMRLFEIPTHCLPEVLPSDAFFGFTCAKGVPSGLPILGVMGDSHASLFGQNCTQEGSVKTSYGTGSSVMMNTGSHPYPSGRGLSTTIAYSHNGRVSYALEGNITHSGDTLVWLCEEAGMAASPSEIETLAQSVSDTGGVYLVPAFSGIGAPYFDETARAAFIGINRSTTRMHMARAALESMAYQNADVIEEMERLSGRRVSLVRADGGGCKNETLMRIQANLLGCEINASDETETSALGAAYMAGFAAGLFTRETADRPSTRRYTPTIDAQTRDALMNNWRSAVSRIVNRKGL